MYIQICKIYMYSNNNNNKILSLCCIIMLNYTVLTIILQRRLELLSIELFDFMNRNVYSFRIHIPPTRCHSSVTGVRRADRTIWRPRLLMTSLRAYVTLDRTDNTRTGDALWTVQTPPRVIRQLLGHNNISSRV